MENGGSRVSPLEVSTSPVHQEIPENQVHGFRHPSSVPEVRSVARKKEPRDRERNVESSQPKDLVAVKLLLFLQVVIICCYSSFVRYDDGITPAKNLQKDPFGPTSSSQEQESSKLAELSHYPLFQDVHVMIFVGFGYLMTFLRRFGYSAVGYNFLLGALAIEWSILCRGVFSHDGNNIPISLFTFINGDFVAAAILISFGAVLGVTSLGELTLMAIVEVFLYAVNEYIGTELLKAADIGGSMFIHTFGAYFGLALSYVLRRQEDCQSDKEGSSYTSDLFAMIGTVFLWMYWPSFNGAVAEDDGQHRAIINTILSLTSSCIVTVSLSILVDPDRRLNMVHIQNATLAGGVAIGAVADLLMQPFGALLVGAAAGVISTLGYTFLTPLLQEKLGLHDTCGVHNLHGMPGVSSGLLAALMATLAGEAEYGPQLYLKYPARSPLEGSRELVELQRSLPAIQGGLHRSAGEQGIYQLAALGVTLLIGLCGGAATGFVLRTPFFNRVPNEEIFEDARAWITPEDEEVLPPSISQVDLAEVKGDGKVERL